MNKYVRAAYCVPCGMLKMTLTKVFNFKNFKGPKVSLISPLTEITLDSKGYLQIGEGFKMRDGAKIRVRNGGKCIIGKNTSVNSYNMIVCHNSIEIGDDVQLSPNVQIYDHDHDFRVEGGAKAGKYKSSPIKIGNNVWIGANTIILRGTEIGDNSVIGAGSVVKGVIPPNSILFQRVQNEIRSIGDM